MRLMLNCSCCYLCRPIYSIHTSAQYSTVPGMGNRLATIDMGRKKGLLCPFRGGGAGSASNTLSTGTMSTTVYCGSISVPSGILIHPAVWPQHIWAENWGMCPFERSWVPTGGTVCHKRRSSHVLLMPLSVS